MRHTKGPSSPSVLLKNRSFTSIQILHTHVYIYIYTHIYTSGATLHPPCCGGQSPLWGLEPHSTEKSKLKVQQVDRVPNRTPPTQQTSHLVVVHLQLSSHLLHMASLFLQVLAIPGTTKLLQGSSGGAEKSSRQTCCMAGRTKQAAPPPLGRVACGDPKEMKVAWFDDHKMLWHIKRHLKIGHQASCRLVC